jgi:peroxiredoxin
MVATLYLLGTLLTAAQTPAEPSSVRVGDWLVVTRLNRAQELVYRGSYTEEANGGRVQFNRAYRLESRVLVLDAQPREAVVAFFTLLKQRETQSGSSAKDAEAPPPSSVRLERATVDLQGKVVFDTGVNSVVPLDEMPSLEAGAFLELPKGRLALEQSWEISEAGRPNRVWRVAGTETVNGASCVKLVGLQQTDDWDKPRADRQAWRRQDTVWLAPKAGYASRVERVIEKRDAGKEKPTRRAVMRYELESSLQYPGQLYEDRKLEITRAHEFDETAAPLLATPAKFGPQLTTLANKISFHLERQSATPYREAVLQVKRRVEAARRGEVVPVVHHAEEPAPSTTVANVGETAPDFLTPDLINSGSIRLQKFAGKPVLLVFYNPKSQTAPELLAFAQKVSTTYPKLASVVGLAMSDDAELVRKQCTELNVTVPTLSGTGLRISYGVETTPKIMVLDSAGVVRGAYVGWGRETADEVQEELRRWLQTK